MGTIIVNFLVNRNGDTNFQKGDTLSGLHTHTNKLKLNKGNVNQLDMKKKLISLSSSLPLHALFASLCSHETLLPVQLVTLMQQFLLLLGEFILLLASAVISNRRLKSIFSINCMMSNRIRLPSPTGQVTMLLCTMTHFSGTRASFLLCSAFLSGLSV